jgi:RNA-splicing ligase RtcB
VLFLRPFLEIIQKRKAFYMRELSGVYTSAKIFTDTIEDYALAQIQMLIDNPVFSGSKVRIMPDVHPGKVCTIGFTATVTDKIMPNVVGIDVGCGMTLAKLKLKKAEFQKFDSVIRSAVPSGGQIRKNPHRFNDAFDYERLRCYDHVSIERAKRSLGTLGGGNHFIELDRDEEGCMFVIIHSGSRYLGKSVTEYYLNQGQKYLKEQGLQIPYELTYLEGRLKEDYIHDIGIVQEFALLNRETILDELVKGMKFKILESYSCSHNYIETAGSVQILRKGAISAKEGEKVMIPINMRDGVLIGKGKGNAEWNDSAPHGAGRIMKRTDVKANFTVSAFKKEMKGIYSSCIGGDTLDEAPFAYRGKEQILENITDTVDVEQILKPVYNFKAGSEE